MLLRRSAQVIVYSQLATGSLGEPLARRFIRSQEVAMELMNMGQSCWAQLAPDLLRAVMGRIETVETCWPARRDVVSCACVCNNWRAIVKEVMRVPESSGQLTFPISLKQVCCFTSELIVFSAPWFVTCFRGSVSSQIAERIVFPFSFAIRSGQKLYC